MRKLIVILLILFASCEQQEWYYGDKSILYQADGVMLNYKQDHNVIYFTLTGATVKKGSIFVNSSVYPYSEKFVIEGIGNMQLTILLSLDNGSGINAARDIYVE